MPLINALGTHLFYDLTGPETAPAIVFSNSIGATLEMWDEQARALAPHYRVLRYDTRGHGRSPVALKDGAPAPVTMDTLADDLAALLEALGIARAHVVGLSLGGMTAQALAIRHPARVHGLVLMATAAHMPGDWADRAALVQTKGMEAIAATVMSRWFTPAFHTHPRALATAERFRATPPDGYAACCHAIGAMDLRPGLPAITAPTLIIAGADDPATPPAKSEEIRALIPGAELVVLSRAAHILNIEQPDATNRHLRAFLDALTPEAATTSSAFDAGLANRKAVLGVEHVERSLANAGPFATPWQDFITRTAWGQIWGDPTLPWKTRSLLTLAITLALNREEEFKLHLRPALRNGVTLPELRALLLHSSVYAGVPASNGAFRWVRDVLGAELDESGLTLFSRGPIPPSPHPSREGPGEGEPQLRISVGMTQAHLPSYGQKRPPHSLIRPQRIHRPRPRHPPRLQHRRPVRHPGPRSAGSARPAAPPPPRPSAQGSPPPSAPRSPGPAPRSARPAAPAPGCPSACARWSASAARHPTCARPAGPAWRPGSGTARTAAPASTPPPPAGPLAAPPPGSPSP